MTDWNERIGRAKKALFTGALWNGDQIDALLDMFNALKDPEPAKKEPESAQPLVRSPEGAFWGMNRGIPFKGSKMGGQIMLGVIGFLPLRPSDAFKPGAVVQFTVNKHTITGPIDRRIEGHMTVRVTIKRNADFDIFFSEMKLVKPAPEVKS